MKNKISLRDLTIHFGDTCALRNLSLDIRAN
jgi:ABC-type transporter Mla maintaining outer membrane lipid asymmetry ATPase subunit MlaF